MGSDNWTQAEELRKRLEAVLGDKPARWGDEHEDVRVADEHCLAVDHDGQGSLSMYFQDDSVLEVGSWSMRMSVWDDLSSFMYERFCSEFPAIAAIKASQI